MFEPIRESLWKSRVNTLIGSIFLSSVALWAGIVIVEASWGVNPVVEAFSAAMEERTVLP